MESKPYEFIVYINAKYKYAKAVDYNVNEDFLQSVAYTCSH